MIEQDVTPTVEEREASCAALREELAATLAAVPAAEAALERADRAREEAELVYQEAGRELAAAMSAGSSGGYGEWSPRSGAEMEADAERERDARATFTVADEELSRRLVARNEIDKRRGGLLMRARQLESLIAAAERDLERARRVPAESSRDLLASIRARLGLGGGPSAA